MQDVPDIILDSDKLESSGAGSAGAAAGRGAGSVARGGPVAGGVGRVNMTWSKATGHLLPSFSFSQPFQCTKRIALEFSCYHSLFEFRPKCKGQGSCSKVTKTQKSL